MMDTQRHSGYPRTHHVGQIGVLLRAKSVVKHSWWRGEPVTARGTVAIWGLLHLASLLGYRSPYPYADLVLTVPWLTEALFSAAAVACIAYAVLPRSRALEMISLVACVVAAAERIVLLTLFVEWIPTGVISLPPPPAFGWLMILTAELFMWPYLRRQRDD